MNLEKVFKYLRENSKNDVELGFGFEQIAKIYFENDDTQIQDMKAYGIIKSGQN